MYSKILLTALVLASLGACVSPYVAVENGPRAKLIFGSENLKGAFLAETDVSLIMYELDSECKLHNKGQIVIDATEPFVDTHIPANTFNFFRLHYFQNSLVNGSKNGLVDFYFFTKNNSQYVINYQDSKLSFSFDILEQTPDQKGLYLDVMRWSVGGTLSTLTYIGNPKDEVFLKDYPCFLTSKG